MLKFVKHHMETIAGIGIFPVMSFLIFFSIFLFALVYVRKSGRAHIQHMSSMPLADNATTNESDHHAQA